MNQSYNIYNTKDNNTKDPLPSSEGKFDTDTSSRIIDRFSMESLN